LGEGQPARDDAIRLACVEDDTRSNSIDVASDWASALDVWRTESDARVTLANDSKNDPLTFSAILGTLPLSGAAASDRADAGALTGWAGRREYCHEEPA
jgi:hypothetical protein